MTTISNKIIIAVLLLLCVLFYFLGRKNGSNNTQTSIVNNAAIIKEIAELGSLSVTGNATIKVSNKEAEGGMYSELKNLFAEKTIHVSIPYEAKYGVDMSHQQVNIDTKAQAVTIYLPEVKLLSMQFKLNDLEGITKNGLLNTTTLDDFVKVEKTLYNATVKDLENNTSNKKLAEEHIKVIFEKYYAPMNLKVQCIFKNNDAALN